MSTSGARGPTSLDGPALIRCGVMNERSGAAGPATGLRATGRARGAGDSPVGLGLVQERVDHAIRPGTVQDDQDPAIGEEDSGVVGSRP